MTIQYYPNSIKVTFDVAAPLPTHVIPRLTATLQNDVSFLSFNVLATDPIAEVIAWLADRSIAVTAVLYNNNVWWIATDYTGDLTI